MYLNEGMNWNFQRGFVPKRMAKFSHVVFRTIKCLELYSKKFIHSSLVYPILTYYMTVWGNSLLTALKPLITNNKQIIRSISSAAFREHTQPIMNYLGLLNLSQI